MDIQVISTLIGVMVGFALAAGWDYWKESRSTGETKKRVRTILSLEIKHNIYFLERVHQEVEAEQRKYKETVKSNGMGGHTYEGNPTKLLRDYHFEVLSRSAWETEMHLLPIALKEQEIESAFSFYSNLNDILVAHDEFQNSFSTEHNPATRNRVINRLLDNVMTRIKSALETRPSICP